MIPSARLIKKMIKEKEMKAELNLEEILKLLVSPLNIL
jgi:hypothetical protein